MIPRPQLAPIGVYLAASYRRKHELRDCAARINALGAYRVTSSWLDEPDQPHNIYTPDQFDQHTSYAEQDLHDIDQSHLFVLFAEADPTVPVIGGGRHFETGYAHARQLPIVLIGPRELIFHYLWGVQHFPTFTDFLANLRNGVDQFLKESSWSRRSTSPLMRSELG